MASQRFPIPQPDTENPAWTRALKAAQCLQTVGARLGGILVRASAGPVRDAWLQFLLSRQPSHRPVRKLPPATPPAKLDPGIDLEATFRAGKPIHQPGMLETCKGGILIVPMAERMPRFMAGRIAQALDADPDLTLVLLDEHEDGEDPAPKALTNRCGLRLDLNTVSVRDAQFVPNDGAAALPVNDVILTEALQTQAAKASAALGGDGLRADIAIQRVSKCLAAIDAHPVAEPRHLAEAIELVFGISLQPHNDANANADDAPEPDTPDEAPPEEDIANDDPNSETPLSFDDLQELLVAAAEAVAPEEALRNTSQHAGGPGRNAASGKAGIARKNAARGRPAGISQRPAYDGQRPDIIATLRTAAPWQRIRAEAAWQPGAPLRIEKSDLRYKRLEHPTETTVIFAVDASGSTALERLGEAKGCIELLLGKCYVRRDQVALISFRGTRAEVLLEPTRSLVRTKKSLTGLPGGGPTPLADAIRQSRDLALRAKARGQQPLIVFLTDGRGNIALDGTADRAKADEDATRMARTAAADGFQTLIIDIARRPRPAASALAQTLHADYCTLPRADAAAMSELVTSYMTVEA
ncbi:MAG: VWA domain-containing protein [Pseudomonadota bacterium]